MTWFDDGDGWRDDSTEGPIDTLKTHFASGGRLTISRSLPWNRTDHSYRIKWDCEEIGRQDSIAMAKAWANQWWKENKNAADTSN